MREIGELIICNRCGKHAFRKMLKRQQLNDGFISSDQYEEFPEGWRWVGGSIGDLCPDCTELYDHLIDGFIKNQQPEEVE